ncbi:3-phosphoshikimate 1-carboxyvinyltransferase [Pedobacter cryoconitis]|uniref:3-phosphoshikimate 1-carboxyvinyltransferase n=1 Tax=Pedobacter cryoconitis TaxID=188932 RepID=A0A7W8YUA7_9SPHI|nr:3-phosphoshikimate 1-carboxyvinyltransferase [Pedobacter cryoconitis]MBB5621935.1 3-phosphoshikimate 1-carboxyvinyltransferase [Pedobacter cryoconitis]MBB5643964.1 3-phosphoshikimate 1-carboxyvinyltransferase [Pedobacter cryoconitis]
MKKNALVSFKGQKDIQATINLTGSKSESNRALIIAAISKGLVKVNNLSDAADTVTLNRILTELNTTEPEGRRTVDVGHAGTAMRFLTAYLSTIPQQFLLTGSARMQERPIGILVDALKSLGADITYAKNEGFPPLSINGGLNNVRAEVSIKGNVSSQYLSALLIIAPKLLAGLSLNIEGGLTSRPYVEMTLALLASAGVSHSWKGDNIYIGPQQYQAATLTVEPDWSAASYWYSIAALADQAAIELPNLKEESLQGDSKIQEIMVGLGVNTQRTADGIALKATQNEPQTTAVLNLKDCPDLAQTIIVCAAAKGLNLAFTGLETLKIKETNRILALQNELAKIGVTLNEDNEVYTLNCEGLNFPEKVTFATYDDHRMAMAFAPLSLLIKEVEIEDFQVVEKSYPDFWKHLEKAGFTVQELA